MSFRTRLIAPIPVGARPQVENRCLSRRDVLAGCALGIAAMSGPVSWPSIATAAVAFEIKILRGHENGVHQAAFSPDERRILTVSFDGTARLWDASTGDPIAMFRDIDDSYTNAAAFSVDGSRIVTASQSRDNADNWAAHVWDSMAGKEIAEQHGSQGVPIAVAFRSDGAPSYFCRLPGQAN
jgi:WD40 repeat protein